MRRAMCLLLALLMFGLAAGAQAAEAASLSGQALDRDSAMAVDLDGDGAAESVSWTMAPGDYDDTLRLTVMPEGGEPIVWDTDILYQAAVYVTDLDGDGQMEILLTGDIMSADYYTVCLHYADGALHALSFADANRGENTDGYFEMGYGLITETGDGRITLVGSQDVLGTWMAARTFTLEDGRFELNDGGIWLRTDDLDDRDLWEYAALTPVTAITYTDDAGSEAVLSPGEKIAITASNKVDAAWFTTQDGKTGRLSIAANVEAGWGYLVNGVPESDLFEFVPYAD